MPREAPDRGPLDQRAAHQASAEIPFSANLEENSLGVRADRDGEALEGDAAGNGQLPANPKTYYVETDEHETFHITVPADWLITFGPMFVSNRQNAPNSQRGIPTAMRFYEGKHQRACLLNVTNFWDLSIGMKEIKEKK